MREVLLITNGLSIKFQGTYVDVMRAHREVILVKRHSEENREKVDEFHQRIHNTIHTLAGKVGIAEDMPRIIQEKQQHRANANASTPSDFHHQTITVPLLDHLHTQLD